MGVWCVVSTIGGKWLSKKLTLKYEEWRNCRNTMTNKPNNELKENNDKTNMSSGVDSLNKTIAVCVPNKFTNNKNNDSNK